MKAKIIKLAVRLGLNIAVTSDSIDITGEVPGVRVPWYSCTLFKLVNEHGHSSYSSNSSFHHYESYDVAPYVRVDEIAYLDADASIGEITYAKLLDELQKLENAVFDSCIMNFRLRQLVRSGD